MPWRETKAMEQRIEFVLKAQEKGVNFSKLCREFGISRTLGYKVLRRYEARGLEGVSPESRRPKRIPGMVSEELVCEIVKLRLRHQRWGGLKLQRLLLERYPTKDVPTARTIDRILSRCNLTERRRKRRGKSLPDGTVIKPEAPNSVWTADFKGWWKTKDGNTCFPLTIRDEYSKYILNISALSGTSFDPTKEQFKRCFQTYGLPRYIRTDNGGPFAAVRSLQGLSRLSAWWIKLGIYPNRIPPSSPQCNGGHERMHRDLKGDLQHFPARTLTKQQELFDDWRDEFNSVRPHQALGMKRPAEVYSKSPRLYDTQEPRFQYPNEFLTRKVACDGRIHWKSKPYFISGSLAKEEIGIKLEAPGELSLWFCEFHLGNTDENFSLPLREGKPGGE